MLVHAACLICQLRPRGHLIQAADLCDCCRAVRLQERMNSNYAELSGAFKTSLEGLARTVQDLHGIIK